MKKEPVFATLVLLSDHDLTDPNGYAMAFLTQRLVQNNRNKNEF